MSLTNDCRTDLFQKVLGPGVLRALPKTMVRAGSERKVRRSSANPLGCVWARASAHGADRDRRIRVEIAERTVVAVESRHRLDLFVTYPLKNELVAAHGDALERDR